MITESWKNTHRPLEYVDVRGIWPQYIRGQVAITLEGKPRDISVDDARATAEALLGRKF